MRVESLIATRYLFGRRGRSVVKVISWISLIGLLVSTAALIVVLSVYNGIGELTKGLFGTFDPELIIEPREGKTFHTADLDLEALRADRDVEAVSAFVQETAWLTYGSNQAIVRLRGVDTAYHRVSGLDTLLSEGYYLLHQPTDAPILLLGGEVWYTLAMRLHSNVPATILIPHRTSASLGYSIDQAFASTPAYPAGYFFIQQDIDREYALTDIATVRQLMSYAPDEVSAIALRLRNGASAARVKQRICRQLPTLSVKDRYDQQPLYYKIFRTERLGIYLILSLIVLISTLSLVASLSLLIMDKRDDIFSLQSLGMTQAMVRRTFLAEGLLICAVAVVAGLLIGFLICFVQQEFGLIRMGDGNFVVDAFPVAMRAIDFLATFLLVMTISSVAVGITVYRAKLQAL